MSKPSPSKSLSFALVAFLVVHAWIAFAYQPSQSDTRLYALYAFVFQDAKRVGQSPYDYYEGVVRKQSGGPTARALRPDEVTIEYPPLALALLRAPLPFVAKGAGGVRGNGKDDVRDWTRGFRWLYFFAHAAIVGAMAWWLRRRGIRCAWGIGVATLAGAVMAYVLYDRLDLLLGLALLGALGALVLGRRLLAMTLLAVAVNLKLVPVLLVPLFLLGCLPIAAFQEGLVKRRSLVRLASSGAAFVAALLAIFVPFRMMWGARVWDFLAYHGQRGFQIESTWSSLLLLAAQFGYPAKVSHVFGAEEVSGPGTSMLVHVSVVLLAVIVLAAYAHLWRALRRQPAQGTTDAAGETTLAQANPQLFVWGSIVLLALAIAGSKVFSPQYLCWFLPLLLLAAPPAIRKETATVLAFLVACGLTALVYPGLWDEVARGTVENQQLVLMLPTPRATFAIVARNAAWIAFCVLAVSQLRTPSRTVERDATSSAPLMRKARRHRRKSR